MANQVQWDTSTEFTSGVDGEAEGQVEVDATQELCAGCVESFVLEDLTLVLSAGTIDFFGRLNAGNRILASESPPCVASFRRTSFPTSILLLLLLLRLRLLSLDRY